MKKSIIFKVLTGLSTVMIVGCVAKQDYIQINTEEEYRTSVVGRSVGVTTTHPDGTMTGISEEGKEIKGTWTWENGLFCREGTIGSDKLDRDCQKIEVTEDKLRVTRNNGNGSQSVFDLK